MKRVVDDPEFGAIEVPPPPSREEFETAAKAAEDALRARRVWPAKSVSQCPNCKSPSFVGRDDLTHRVSRPGGVVIFRRLRGARCEACKEQSLEPADLMAVEQEAGIEVMADFEARVTTIGTGTLGTYWPKDVVRNLHLTPGKRAYIQILDRDTALVRFVRGPPGDPARKRKKSRQGTRAARNAA